MSEGRRLRAFAQVNVFSQEPFRGNPLAVVLDALGLDDSRMQEFARWTQLSETCFVLPPSAPAQAQGADYQVRIFTPTGELPFAGHPTLGSCHAWLAQGGQPQSSARVVQECKKGLVPIELHADRLAFEAPPLLRSTPPDDWLAEVAAALGLRTDQIRTAQWLDNGSRWLGVLADEVGTVLACEPDHTALKRLGAKVGLCALYPEEPAAPMLIARASREARAFSGSRVHAASTAAQSPQLEVRGFAAASGIAEDPVTGSLNAGLAQWLTAEGLLSAPYIANQGRALERDGWVYVNADAQGALWIGGHTVTCIQGQVVL